MKSFLIKSTLFVLPILVLLGMLEYVQRELPHDYKHKKALLESKLDSIEVLIVGNSHSYMGINPEFFEEKGFNLAYTAQTLSLDHFLLHKYLPEMKELKHVVMPVSYSFYGADAPLYPGIYNKTYYFAHFYGSRIFTKWYDPRLYSLVALYTVKRSVDRTMRYVKGIDPLIECDENGWFGSDYQRNLEENARKNAKMHDLYFDTELYRTNIKRLQDIINLCQTNDVELHLVSLPMWPSYLEQITPERLSFLERTTDSIADANGIEYLNYRWDDSFVSEDFFDSNHLSARGSAKFSAKLNKELFHASGE